MDQQYDDTNRGSLFKPRASDNLSVEGKVNIDGVDHRVVLVKRVSQGGKAYWEMYQSMGKVFKAREPENPDPNKNYPSLTGFLGEDSETKTKDIAVWRVASDKLEAGYFYSVRVNDPYRADGQAGGAGERSTPGTTATTGIIDDDIPF